MKVLVSVSLLWMPVGAAAQARPLVTIGGESGVEFGSIVDAVSMKGRIIVLDKNAPHLRLLNEDGRLLQTAGRGGSGPGEFRIPWSLAVDSTSKTVFVVDPANARVTEYALEDTLGLKRTIATSIRNLRALCVLRGRFFGSTLSTTHLLDELEVRDGRLVSRRPLGKVQSNHPLAAHPLVGWRTGDGPVFCDGAGYVWMTSSLLGDIHRVDVESGSQQSQTIRDFQPILLQSGSGGTLTMSVPASGWYERVSSLLPTSNGVRVVLSLHGRGDSLAGYQAVDISSDLRTHSQRVRTQWRQVALAARGVICVVNDPAPTMAIFGGRGCP